MMNEFRTSLWNYHVLYIMNHKTMKPIIPRGEKLELKIFRTFLFIMTELNVLGELKYLGRCAFCLSNIGASNLFFP